MRRLGAGSDGAGGGFSCQSQAIGPHGGFGGVGGSGGLHLVAVLNRAGMSPDLLVVSVDLHRPTDLL
eukprot:11696751-Karenia_brevis.AAC.1